MFLPFLNGPEFLGVFLILWAILFIGTWFVDFSLKRSTRLYGEALPDLNPLELAYLASGPAGAVNVAIIRLGALGILQLEDSGKIVRTETQPESLSPLDEAIATMALPGTALKPDEVRAKAREFLEPVRIRLEELGLIVAAQSRSRLAKGFWYGVLFLVVLGVIRGISGIINQKPSGFIWTLNILLPVFSLLFWGLISRTRTQWGNQVFKKYQNQNLPLKTGAQQLNDPNHADKMAMAVALFGILSLGAIRTNPWARALLPYQPGGGSTDYASSSCSSSDGGSSGSSDGGGGGGGCGGCGGGGGGD